MHPRTHAPQHHLLPVLCHRTHGHVATHPCIRCAVPHASHTATAEAHRVSQRPHHAPLPTHKHHCAGHNSPHHTGTQHHAQGSVDTTERATPRGQHRQGNTSHRTPTFAPSVSDSRRRGGDTPGVSLTRLDPPGTTLVDHIPPNTDHPERLWKKDETSLATRPRLQPISADRGSGLIFRLDPLRR